MILIIVQKLIIHPCIIVDFDFNRILRFNANGKFNLPVGNVDFNKNDTVLALNNYFKVIRSKKKPL